MRRGRVAILAALLLVACATGPRVPLDDSWPNEAPAYAAAYEQWMRFGAIRSGYDEILQVYALYKSPAWRTAWVYRRAKALLLPDDEVAALLAEQRREAQEFHEVELLVSTYNRDENDLAKGERSIWRLALVDDDGREVTPVSVTKDRRPRDVIRAEYPDFGDFATAYVVRFPRTFQVLGADARQFSLKMASTRGGIELLWKAP